MSLRDAIAAGIQVIYQDFSIFPNLNGNGKSRIQSGISGKEEIC